MSQRRVGEGALIHTDGAPNYAVVPEGVLHDAVPHSKGKKRAKPIYVKKFHHEDADGNEVVAMGGTQSLDGWFTHAKNNCRGVKASCPESVEQHIREEQWRHWIGNADRWKAAAEVLQWVPE